MATNTNSAAFLKPTPGADEGQWGNLLNTSLDQIDRMLAGVQTVTLTTGTVTIPAIDAVSDNPSRAPIIALVGTLSGNVEVIVPDVTRMFVVVNGSVSGGHQINVRRVSGGTGVQLATNGHYALVATTTAVYGVIAAEADHAATADLATLATLATNAGHATTADSATTTPHADHATHADTATTATTATTTDHATTADQAVIATSADTAITAINSTFAQQATTATTCSGNSATATTWAAPVTVTLTGGATGAAAIDGSGNVTIPIIVPGAEHSHSDYAPKAGSTSQAFSVGAPGSSTTRAIRRQDRATETQDGTIRARLFGNQLYLSTNGVNP